MSFVFFFFKQKTAYEMRISDWSSDVCSSDLFQAVEVKDPLRTKQLRVGLTQLGEEGAIQVFRPEVAGGSLLLGAVGQLQFEVVAHRLKTEYGVEARLMPSRYNMARWFTAEDPKILRKLMNTHAAKLKTEERTVGKKLVSQC